MKTKIIWLSDEHGLVFLIDPLTGNQGIYSTFDCGRNWTRESVTGACECGKDKHGFASHSNWCPMSSNKLGV